MNDRSSGATPSALQNNAVSPLTKSVMSHSHSTPPRHLSKIKNPFERTLVEKLGSHTCSPGMFKIRESSGGSFKWDIEQVSILQPADIVACNSQFHLSPDPVLEKKATEAIDKFFSQEVIVPSPYGEASKKVGIIPKEVKESASTLNSNKCTAWTQTNLTFPTILTPEMESMLEQFFTFKGDQNVSDADISANLSLKRKLLFEKEMSDNEENFVIPTFVSSESLRGTKRTLNSSESLVCYNSEINTEMSFHTMVQKSASPVLEAGKYGRCISDDISQQIKSPSLSPISLNNSDKDYGRKNTACRVDLNYSFDASVCSQSTPEKSLLSSNSNIDSSPENFDSSKMKLLKENIQFDKTRYKQYHHTSYLEFSYNEEKARCGKSSSMDMSNDVSMQCNDHQCIRENSNNSLSNQILPNNLEMEFINTDLNVETFKNIGNFKSRSDCRSDNERRNVKYEVFEDKNSSNSESNDRFSDVYQFITPTKNFRKGLMDITNKSPLIEKNWCSPMQMSFDNSYNFDMDRSSLKNSERSNNENIVNSTNMFKDACKNLYGCDEFRSKPTKSSFHSMDSGFLENVNKTIHHNSVNVTVCNNSTKYNTNMDVTKSFQSTNNDSSSVGWKRFDSGFHDETSSDFTCHITQYNETAKTKKFTSVVDYMNDNKKTTDNYETCLDYERHRQNSISVSETFTDDVISFMKYNFSSTPSKKTATNNISLL